MLLGLWPLVAESSGLASTTATTTDDALSGMTGAPSISMGVVKARCMFARGRNAFRAIVCNLFAVMSDKDEMLFWKQVPIFRYFYVLFDLGSWPGLIRPNAFVRGRQNACSCQ